MKKAKAPEKENSERWLVTYSDLMNLLLILFIILYAMSQVDKAKAEAVAESIRAGFGYVENGGTGAEKGEGTGLYAADFTTPGDGTTTSQPGDPGASASSDLYWSEEALAFQNFYEDVMKLIKDNNLENMVDVTIDDRGVVISFKDNVLFASGQAYLGNDSLSLIDQIGKLLTNLRFAYILVEGHTDTDPIHTAQFSDNMDLSNQRAANVWRELVKCGLSPDKMASIGYGEYRPIAPNDTPENKAKNRRVVVTILRHPITTSQQINSSGETAATGNATASPSPSTSPEATKETSH